jgi:hypothetical protein
MYVWEWHFVQTQYTRPFSKSGWRISTRPSGPSSCDSKTKLTGSHLWRHLSLFAGIVNPHQLGLGGGSFVLALQPVPLFAMAVSPALRALAAVGYKAVTGCDAGFKLGLDSARSYTQAAMHMFIPP